MKHWNRLLCLLLCAALVLGLAGCGNPQTDTTTAPPETTTAPAPTEPDIAEVYALAVTALEGNEDLEIMTEINRATVVGGETFEKSTYQTLTWQGLGTDGLLAKVEEKSYIGDVSTQTDELFADGSVYADVDGNSFTAQISAEDYLARYLPAVLLDASLYGSITKDGYTIRFEAPSGLESWAAPAHAQLISASGTVQLNADNNISASTYLATFTQGSAEITLEIEATIRYPEALDLAAEIPGSPEGYVTLDSIDAPRILMDALGYACQAESARSMIIENTVSNAAAAMVYTTTEVAMYGGVNNHMSDIAYNATIYDFSASVTGDVTTYRQVEHFEDGSYSIAFDDGEPEPDARVTASDMHYYAGGYLYDNFCTPEDLSGAVLTDLGGIYLLEMTFNDNYAANLSSYVSQVMTGDPQLLDSYAEAYATTTAECYLAVNADTGLPTACGINYAGSHTIDGMEYPLSLQADQSITIAASSSYEAITDEPLPAEEPETKATPLFYHVTGQDGQEMWLLGTIHVGDSRTAFLPQEIYDAFDASDALAVECNVVDFEEELEQDESLQTLVSECYFYLDGSLTADHLDDEIYAKALQLMKASGNHSLNALMMKPSLWESSISNFYIQQGYRLTAEQGVDYQLIRRADEMDKPIWEIESNEFQVRMTTGFSDPLQEMLLEETISTPMLTYQSQTMELFEKWCQGDEEVLREAVRDDLTDMTDTELTLYDEYNTAMMTDRNAAMLEVAIEYLESDSVVFYAVGLAHLLSDDGLVNTLRDAGYTVELVPYA